MIETELSSQKDFENSIENGVTLVDFNAPWCAPCRAQEPILDEVQKTFEGKATFIKINIDHNQEIAVKLGIQSIPTLVFFKEGKELARLIGIQDNEALDRVLTNIIK
ncbi:MAG: thioredoxin [Thermodesulfobacteriota bacterium]